MRNVSSVVIRRYAGFTTLIGYNCFGDEIACRTYFGVFREVQARLDRRSMLGELPPL